MSNKEFIVTNQHLFDMINDLPEQIFFMDTEGRIINCNKRQCELAGCTTEKELIGQNIFDVGKKLGWSDEIVETIRNNDLYVMEHKKELTIEEIIILDNEKRIFLTTKKPVFDKNGNVIGISGVSIDITERKKAEQLAVEHKILQEKLKVQEASNKYIGTLAHELRTPLSSFKVILNLIEMNDENNSENPDERRRNLKMFTVKGDQVEKAGLSFIEMILYKIRSMTNKLDREKFQFCLIRDEVTDVLDKYPFNAGERELVSFDQANGFVYKGDRVATSHILFNLIKNTLKIINEEDRGKITIRFDKSDEKYNKLIFEDDAKGVDPKFLPYMFDSFVYKDSTGKGTGLGLAYCKMVMEDYDGDIICESELGKYTRFICLFPKVDMSEFDFA